MSKQIILDTIKREFFAMNLSFAERAGADITLSMDFWDARWGTGKKKIEYETSIYLEERNQTVFMWEKTAETGQGFSFGFSGESYSQSGATLSRKVKNIQIGLDGRAYECEIDLGRIAGCVKQAAAQNGWKFKTVLSRKKASYPM